MSVIIRLQNLPISANASNIRRFFGGLSIPEGGVHIVGGNEGDAFIAFATDEDARKAMLLDRQSINNAPVRLFLSSKAEMQSIIESARSSALFSGAPVSSLPQSSVPQKTETMNALDVTAPTLPSSFPSYRNGTARETPSHDTNDSYSYMHPKSANPVPDPFVRPLPKVTDDYSSDSPMVPARLERSHNDMRDRGYGYDSQPPLPTARYDIRNVEPPRSDFNSTRDNFNDRDHHSGYKSYYDDYEYNRGPYPGDHFASRPKDVQRDSPRGHYPGNFPTRPVNEEIPQDYDSYSHNLSPRGVPDRFPPPEAPRDTIRASVPPHPIENRNFSTRPPDHDPFPSGPLEERDFSVRPPWLSEDAPSAAPKRPYQAPVSDPEDFQPKRRPLPPPASKLDTEHMPDNSFVIRVSLPIAEVGIRAAFEILRGVHIVPKWGIRIEEDSLQRPTGYIFIMTTTRDSYDRALSYDNRTFRGYPVRITSSSINEFYQVSDPNFINKCPPDMVKKLPTPEQCCPPHHSDGCLELTELPADTTKSEVVRFLGAPGLTVDNVVIARYPPSDKSAPRSDAIRALVTLPSANDIKILLSAKPRPFRQGSPLPPARLTPISKLQLLAYSTFATDRNPERSMPRVSEPIVQQVDNDSSLAPSKTPEVLTCAFLSGFSRFVKDAEVLRLFPSIIIPGDAIRMGPDNTSAYVDFISENNCRRAIKEVSDENSRAKSIHPSLKVEAISRREMESRLGLDSRSAEQPSFDRTNRPRDSRNQWDSRPPRSNQAPFDNRPAAPGRPPFDDPHYERPGPQHYDDFSRRRMPPPVDAPSGGPGPHADAPRPVVQPPIAPPRRAGFDVATVFVGNLPQTINVDQLAGIFRDYFFIPGSIRLRRDPQGQPMGEALVDFKTSYEADRALRALNGFRVGNRPIVLRYDHRG